MLFGRYRIRLPSITSTQCLGECAFTRSTPPGFPIARCTAAPRTVRRRPMFVSEVSAGPIVEKGLRAAQQPSSAPRAAARLLFSAPSFFTTSSLTSSFHHRALFITLKLQRFSTQPSTPCVAPASVPAARDFGGILRFSISISSDLPLIARLHGASSIELALFFLLSSSGQAFCCTSGRLTPRVRRNNAPQKIETRPAALGCF